MRRIFAQFAISSTRMINFVCIVNRSTSKALMMGRLGLSVMSVMVGFMLNVQMLTFLRTIFPTLILVLNVSSVRKCRRMRCPGERRIEILGRVRKEQIVAYYLA
jgi:hypothetical protein